jgi:subtilisin
MTDKNGKASIGVPPGHVVSFVEPIPYAGFWIMLAEAPPSGSTIDCVPIAKSGPNGAGWWHEAMNVDVTDTNRGASIRVGVIDTGCGPHPNLAHVTLVGAFVDGGVLPPDQGADVAEHGTHTSGIIGARPSKAAWLRAASSSTRACSKARRRAPRRRTSSMRSTRSRAVTNAT